jgi:protein-disulfide isomerase
MSDSPRPTDPDEAADIASAPPKHWSLWLGVGVFGVAGVALIVSLFSLFREAAPPTQADNAAETAPTEVSDQPADLQAHQQWVSEAVADLGRDVLIGDSPTLGNPEAEIVLLEFSDFECPYCAQAPEQVKAFLADHDEDVLFVFKHLPLTNIHAQALPAALAAWAAGQQGQFWPYHDALFMRQNELGDELYVSLAEELGLDMEQFERDRTSDTAKAAIARDLALANELKLNSTPTFIMGNMLIPGVVPAEFLAEALARLQANSSRVVE